MAREIVRTCNAYKKLKKLAPEFHFFPHITWVLSDMGRDRRVIYSVSRGGVLR